MANPRKTNENNFRHMKDRRFIQRRLSLSEPSSYERITGGRESGGSALINNAEEKIAEFDVLVIMGE
jgi:hypothetical protein